MVRVRDDGGTHHNYFKKGEGMNETSGRMTGSWRPSDSVLREIRDSLPHVHPLPVVPQFRDYYMDPARNAVRSRSEWDRRFLSWCGKREEAWLTAHQEVAEDKFDPVTGMPVRPRPIQYAPREEQP